MTAEEESWQCFDLVAAAAVAAEMTVMIYFSGEQMEKRFVLFHMLITFFSCNLVNGCK